MPKSHTHKKCPRCQQVLPLTDFTTCPTKKDGRAVHCRPCAAARIREYRATPEGLLATRASSRAYAERNRRRNLAQREAGTTTPE